MKTFLKYIFVITTLSLSAVSCRDEEAVRFPELQEGANARIVINPSFAFFNGGDIENTYISVDVYTINTNIQEIICKGVYTDVSTGDVYPSTEIFRIPGNLVQNGKISDFRITAAMVAEALDLPGGATFLNGGDNFVVSPTVVLTDGRTFEPANSAPSIAGGTNASFTAEFTLAVACDAFATDDATGTYVITRDDFEVDANPGVTVEIIAGPGENQMTMKNLFHHAQEFDVVLTVDPETSAVTIEKQEAWDTGAFALPYGIASVEGDGTFYSCAGFITLSLEHTVDLGSFGFYTLQLSKQ